MSPTRTRSKKRKLLMGLAALAATIPVAASNIAAKKVIVSAVPVATPAPTALETLVEERRRADFAAMQAFRPGYPFWQHVFTLPDGSIAYGSATDGHLIATFPAKGDWVRQAKWADPAFAHLLDGQPLARKVTDRRDQVEMLLEGPAGPTINNSTRGDALRPNEQKYGAFLAEWGAIYERFGVPADIGLAQVVLESGLSPTRRSEANAIGFCQWLQKNWERLNDFSPTPIEGRNQTTQAPYCAAYLSVLATKYGSFIPALSEHNAGGTNVGRTLITGEHLGATDVRARYLVGSQLAHQLRGLRERQYREVYRTYGPRSYLYAEMVFGNTFIVKRLMASTPQRRIYAMRPERSLTLAEIMSRTDLTAKEIRRFNPALVDRLPAHAALYLPKYVTEFGPDVAFWRRPPSAEYEAVLNDFVHLDAGPERWDDPSFAPVLAEFKRRFRATNTEEGTVMETVLTYEMDQAYTSSRRELLTEFRDDKGVQQLIDRGAMRLEWSGAGANQSEPKAIY